MQKNIIAVLNHSVEHQDPAMQHRFCPTEKDSWCRWQQQKVTTGTATYKDGDCLPEVFLELLRPTFMTLSDSKLLERCIRGTTQNPNECINSMVWMRCPKHKHYGAKVVHFAAASAVCHYHKGAKCRMEIMEKLSIPGGIHTKHSVQKKDKKRLYTYLRKVFHHLEQNGLAAASILIRPMNKGSLEPYLIILNALFWREKYLTPSFDKCRKYRI